MTNLLNQENFIDNNLVQNDTAEFVTIKYHTDFPQKDSFNEDNPVDPGARALYYGISNVPQAVIDGSEAKVNNDSIQAQAARRILQLSPFDISVASDTSQAGGIKITGTIKALTTIDSTIINAYAAVVELSADENGQSSANILRKLLPGPAGVSIPGAWKPGDTQSFSLIWGLGNVDSVSNLRVILFLQDAHTKEILQAAYIDPKVLLTRVTGLINNEFSSEVKVYPNPASSLVFIKFPKILSSRCDWAMVSQNGVIYNNGYLNPGQQKYELDISKAPQGVYILVLDDKKALNHTGKLIIIH